MWNHRYTYKLECFHIVTWNYGTYSNEVYVVSFFQLLCPQNSVLWVHVRSCGTLCKNSFFLINIASAVKWRMCLYFFLFLFFRTQTIVLKGLKYFTRRSSCVIVQATLVFLIVSKLTFFFVLVPATFSMEETAAAVAWQSVTLARGAWNLSSVDILCRALKKHRFCICCRFEALHINLTHLGAEQPWSHESLAFISIGFCGRYAIFLVYTSYILNVQVAPLSPRLNHVVARSYHSGDCRYVSSSRCERYPQCQATQCEATG